jgi:PKD repeat protein
LFLSSDGGPVYQGPLNQPPHAAFTDAVNGFVVNFDASASYDPDGAIVSYAWNFGDAASGTGEYTSHVYTAPGTYTATLIVTDNDGATNSVTHPVTVSYPISKDQCKSGGWQNYGGIFKNQGDCVSFVSTGGGNPPANG